MRVLCVVILAILITTVAAGPSPKDRVKRDDNCSVRPNDRVECPGAYPGISAVICQDKGCCFDNSIRGTYWCFTRPGFNYAASLTNKETCSVAPDKRRDCGHPRITEEDCEDRGCCFDDSIHGTFWCFPPTSETTCAVEPKDRTKCPGAYPGISAVECQNKGCCFDNSIRGTYWCFTRPAVPTTKAPTTIPTPVPFECPYCQGTRNTCKEGDTEMRACKPHEDRCINIYWHKSPGSDTRFYCGTKDAARYWVNYCFNTGLCYTKSCSESRCWPATY